MVDFRDGVDDVTESSRQVGSHRTPKTPMQTPLVAACVMAGVGILFGGVGIAQLAMGSQIASAQSAPVVLLASATPSVAPSTSAPADEGDEADEGKPDQKSIEFEDKNENGVPDALEKPVTVKDKPAKAGPTKKAEVYTIVEGDTLAQISGRTGVPVDLLIEANKIKNPNLIYAGAALIIPITQ